MGGNERNRMKGKTKRLEQKHVFMAVCLTASERDRN